MEPSQEPISVRLNKINAYIFGKLDASYNFTNLLSKESLLDTLQLLYEECNSDCLKNSDKNISQFVEANRRSINTLKQLRVNISDFEIKNVIGRGHFGDVHLIKEKQTGDIYAMKTIKKYKSLEQKYKSFEEEKNIMAFSTSPWLTSLQYAFQDSANLYFVMEYHPGGDLLGLLQRQGGTLPESAASFYIAELVLGINDIHSMGYVHRDIKPDNILLDRCGHIKIADFGSASKLDPKGGATHAMPIGTPEYISPEVLQSLDNKNENIHYGVSCDYWSVGILAYELTIGNTPFTGQNTSTIYSKIINHANNLKFPHDVVLSQGYVSLIKGLLCKENTRLTYKEIITHPLYKNVDFTSLRDQVPPYVPKVTSDEDISNFTDILVKKHEPHIDNFKVKTQFSGKNLPFIGFTYTSNICNEYRDLHNSSKSLMKDETLLNMKKEIERLQKAVLKKGDSLQELENMQLKYEDKCRKLESIENVRNMLEKDLANNIAESSALKRTIELERKDRKDLERKALDLIKSTKLKWEASEKSKIDALNNEIFKLQSKIMDLENENKSFQDQIKNKLQSENEHKLSLERVENLSRRSVISLESRLQKITTQSQNEISEIQTKLVEEIAKSADLETKILKYEKANNAMKIEIENLLIKLKATQKSNNDFKVKIKDLEDQLELLDKSNENVENNTQYIEQLEKENISLKNKVSNFLEVENKLKAEENKCVAFEEELEALKAELDFEKISHQTALDDIENKNRIQIQDLNSKLHEALNKNIDDEQKLITADLNEENFKSKIKTLEELLIKLQNGVSNLENSSEKQLVLQQQIERLEGQLVQVHETFAVEKQEFIQLKSKHWRMEKDLQNATLDKKIIERDLKETQQQNTKLTEEIESLNTQLSDNRKMHEKALLELNNLNENLTNEVVKLSDLVQKLEDKVNCEKEKCDDEKTLVQQLNREILVNDREHQSLKVQFSNLELEKNNVEKQLANFEANNIKLMNQFERVLKEKADLINEIENYKREQHNNQLNQSALREACTLLENQLEEFEQLYKVSEDKRTALSSEIEKLRSDVIQEQKNVAEARKLTNEEKSFKLLAETKCKRMSEEIEHLQKDNASYKEECNELKTYSSNLAEELTGAEQKISELEIECKTLSRKIENYLSENKLLKEENSTQLTHLNSVKESNYKLSQDLTEFRGINKALFDQIEQLNNILVEKDIYIKERELKTESTIQQQTKLIDFLQSKLQMEENKKKKTLSDKLFGHSKKENEPPLSVVLNYKDLEQQLSKERETTKNLRQEIVKLKSQSYPSKPHKANPILNIKDQNLVLEQIVQSPQRNEFYRQNSVQRMQHNIPHRFDTKLCTKSTTCAQCKQQILLGRSSNVCSECLVTAHPQCAESLPRTCGLPQGFVKHYSDSLSKLQEVKCSSEGESSVEKDDIHIEGWVKIPVKTAWEKYYACLTSSKITIYEEPPNHDSVKVVKSLELKPPDSYGKVTMEPVISEIGIPVANSDLPFVLKVDVCPNTTCWPSKYLIFMTLNTDDKNKWYKGLMNILSNKTGEKYKGENICPLEIKIHVNCLIDLDKEIKLFGADKGLYSYYNDVLNHISGPLDVQQIATLPKLNLALMIVDDSRVLISCDLRHIHSLCQCAPCSKPVLQFKTINIKHMNGFHLFQVCYSKQNMLCIANARQLVIMKYDLKCNDFMPERILDTAKPTSCILFTEHSLIIGADKLFEIDLATYHADEFLDASDEKISPVISCYKLKLFPLAILQISQNPLEYVICFNEFAIFVDEYGRSTRSNEIKWNHLPSAFHYHNNYLYIVQFYAVEIIKINSDTMNDSNASTDFDSYRIELPNLKYLGQSNNGIYVKSGNDIKLISARSINPDASLVLSTDTDQIDSESDRFSFTSSIVQSLDGNLNDSTNVLPEEDHKKVTFATDL